jgi:S1-C subfamily serine protease
MKNLIPVYIVIIAMSGCASYSQIMINAQGQMYRCGSYGSGLVGIAHANQINEDCIESLRSAGYIELEKAGVIGITLGDQSQTDTILTIIKVADNSPAFSSGIHQGDVLVAINEQSVRKLLDAKVLLFGLAGTKVSLTTRRNVQENKVTLVRAPYTRVYGMPAK